MNGGSRREGAAPGPRRPATTVVSPHHLAAESYRYFVERVGTACLPPRGREEAPLPGRRRAASLLAVRGCAGAGWGVPPGGIVGEGRAWRVAGSRSLEEEEEVEVSTGAGRIERAARAARTQAGPRQRLWGWVRFCADTHTNRPSRARQSAGGRALAIDGGVPPQAMIDWGRPGAALPPLLAGPPAIVASGRLGSNLCVGRISARTKAGGGPKDIAALGVRQRTRVVGGLRGLRPWHATCAPARTWLPSSGD